MSARRKSVIRKIEEMYNVMPALDDVKYFWEFREQLAEGNPGGLLTRPMYADIVMNTKRNSPSDLARLMFALGVFTFGQNDATVLDEYGMKVGEIVTEFDIDIKIDYVNSRTGEVMLTNIEDINANIAAMRSDKTLNTTLLSILKMFDVANPANAANVIIEDLGKIPKVRVNSEINAFASALMPDLETLTANAKTAEECDNMIDGFKEIVLHDVQKYKRILDDHKHRSRSVRTILDYYERCMHAAPRRRRTRQ